MPPSDLRITRAEAAPLVQAVSASVLAGAGVRSLAIKGPVLARQGLRADKRHADVDVLVSPDELRLAMAALVDAGWREGGPTSAPSILPTHSVNLLNDFWPITIDLHHYFPGFLGRPAEVFDELWKRRVSVDLAQVQVDTLDPVAHAALSALHLLRVQRPDCTTRIELADLAARVRSAFEDSQIADLLELAEVTHSLGPLRPFLELVGVPEERLPHQVADAGYALWELRATAPSSYPWIYLLRHTPAHRLPSTIFRALWLTEAELRTYHAGPTGTESLSELRWRRIRRGLRSVPRAWWDRRRAAQRHRQESAS